MEFKIEGLKQEIVEVRRYIHKNPEIGYREYNTNRFIKQYLISLGFDRVDIIAETGIKAVLFADNAHQTVAFRSDMDALEGVQEKNDVSYKSKVKNMMHACGHDGHIAILLGLAKYLSLNTTNLTKNVVLIFQPAEESNGGAKRMIDEGVLDDPKVDCIFGIHLFPGVEQGKVVIQKGELMAQTVEFNIEIHGKAAHGAMPHLGIDTISIAAQLINMFQSILTRTINPYDAALITFGRIMGGERRNIIAQRTVLEGILRTFSQKCNDIVIKKMNDIIQGLERSWGTKIEYTELTNYPVVYNDPYLTEQVAAMFAQGEREVVKPLMIAEDFSFYQKKVPGLFMLLGTKNEHKGYIHPLHSDRFNFDEEVLLKGVEIFKTILEKPLNL
ncbi:MAG: M20 metallopeptidase family protein [Mahellales bacterium]|jgi:amidohydrolase